MEKLTLLGIDLAKNVFQLHGTDHQGKMILRRRLSRTKLVEFITKLPPCTVVMEACSGASYWCRKFGKFGHETKLIAPQFVKPFRKNNKNDRNDSEAICEAASRPSMRYVAPKTVEQEDIQALHRIRSRLIQERTALVNQIRGLLAEYGIIVPVGIHKIRRALPEILEDTENELSARGRRLFANLYTEIGEKDKAIKIYDIEIEEIFKSNEACQRISAIEGIGTMTATAIIATMGDPKLFKNGRHFSAFLGLVPRQFSSGNKIQLFGISKCGNNYLRMLLIHGARSVVRHASFKEDRRSKWIKALKERSGSNRTAVAVANKNARIVWALLAKDELYKKVA